MSDTKRPLQPLIIPFDDGLYAVIPMGISKDDFRCLKKTLKLWESRMVDKSKITPEEKEMVRIFGPAPEQPQPPQNPNEE